MHLLERKRKGRERIEEETEKSEDVAFVAKK